MKKLITLLLVLTGCVMLASAAEYTVYFKPGSNWTAGNAKFALYMWKDGVGSYTKHFAETSAGSGIYSVSYDSNYDTGILFLRVDPNTNKTDGEGAIYGWTKDSNYFWGQSGNFSAPTSNIFVDHSGSTWYESWDANNGNIVVKTPSSYISTTYTIITDGEGDILPNFMDANSSANNSLTSNSDFTYSKTVTGNIVRAGSYGFKISDGSTTYSDGGSAWTVAAAANGVYTIDYTFNCVTGVASATATKTDNATITEKYIITGDEALVGHNWETSGSYNVMTVSEGTGTLALNNLKLDADTYNFKAAHLLFSGGTKYKTIIGDQSSFSPVRNSVWNANFSCTTSTLDVSSSTCSEVAGYFVFGGTDGWSLGQRMTESAGVYTATFSNRPGYAFVIVPTSNLKTDNSVNNWGGVVRPTKTENERTYLAFANVDGTTIDNEGDKIGDVVNEHAWAIQANGGDNNANDADVTLTFTPGLEHAGTWAVTCTDDLTIGTAGYATYSNYYKFTVSGAEKIYTVNDSDTEKGKVTLKEQGNNAVFAGNTTPIIIKGSGKITINPSDEEATTLNGEHNYLVGSNNGTLSVYQGDGKYIFNWDGSDPSSVGFYKANNGTLGAHKAYLNLSALGSREFYGFDFDEPTGIEAVESNPETVKENAREYYNLNGQRVMNPSKGLYIVNGKKVIIK